MKHRKRNLKNNKKQIFKIFIFGVRLKLIQLKSNPFYFNPAQISLFLTKKLFFRAMSQRFSNRWFKIKLQTA